MGHRLLWSVPLACLALASPVQADTLTRGREAAETFLRGDARALWTRMTPDMQNALGSAEALATVRRDLAKTFGSEDRVLSEQRVRQEPHEIYTRIAQWTDSPTPIQLLVTFDQSERISGFFVRPVPVAAASRYLNYETQARLRLPFDDAWHVYWGGRAIETNYHAVDTGQRFAVDLLVLKDGRSHTGDPAVLENYHCWDRPILAPGDGVVVRAADGFPDQPIGSTDPSNPLGNHVVLDFGNDEYGFLAHLREGSVKVAEGDRITAGTEIGRCGNSGNTSEPHLHFHLQNSPQFGQGDGLPAQFVDYLADGTPVGKGEPTKGQSVRPSN